MHLTRTGFNVLVAIWLMPLIAIDIVSNTLETGATSDLYYYKSMADGVLICYALWQAFFRPATASASSARARQADKNDDVVAFESIGGAEYIYCALLFLYSVANWYFLHGVNKSSTGVVSIASLIWSFLSLGIAILSAIQFWNLKSGAIVELKSKVVQ